MFRFPTRSVFAARNVIRHFLVIFAAFCVMFPPLTVVGQQTIYGNWSGTISLMGADWPAELLIEQIDGNVNAQLSLPELGYFLAGQNVVESNQELIEIEFPFGLGSIELQCKDQELLGSRMAGNNELAIKFARAAPGAPTVDIVTKNFRNGDIQLEGWLFRPGESGQVKTIVLLHGSSQGGLDSWTYRGAAHLLCRMGYQVFVYNKRSADQEPNLSDLVSDAVAAVEFANSLGGEQPVSVGLVGGSQAGWIAAAVAATVPEKVSLVAITGWPAVNPRQQEIHRVTHELLAEDFSSQEIESAIAYVNFYFYVVRNQELWPELVRASEIALEQKWGGIVETPLKKEDLQWWAANHDFATWDHLRKLQCPVLAMYGEGDNLVPPSENAALLEKLIASSGNEEVTIRIYPGADHRIELPSGPVNGVFQWPRLSPDYLQDLQDWLDGKGLSEVGRNNP